MRLQYATICVAMAACQVASSHAVPSRSNPGVPNKRHLRSKSSKLALNEEERFYTFDLNVAYEDTAENVLRKEAFFQLGLNPLDVKVAKSIYFTEWMHYVDILNEGRNSDGKVDSAIVFKKILDKASN
ncbi:hypothetical protein KXD40_001118 [Peronospora effusa]|nr:hypothetical protein KXD40_001118 [Peronospora effusa]